MLTIYTDAATKGKLGPSGVGILIIHNQEQLQLSIPLNKHYTNHEAEFIAQILAFEYLYKNFNLSTELIRLYTDSKIVNQTISKNYVTTSFKDYGEKLLAYYQKTPNAFLNWIPEKKNKGADNLAKQALHKALQGNTTNYPF